MKVKIDEDEWYPVYSIVDSDDKHPVEIELTEEQVAFIKQVQEDFDRAQEVIRPLVKAKMMGW